MARRKKSNRKRWVRRLVLTLLALMALYLAFEWLTWPDVEALKTKRPETTAFIEHYLAKSGRKTISQIWVRYEDVPTSFKHAILCGEDIGFLGHDGFDSGEISDAFKDAVFEGKRLRGASTITQQLAKNLWLSASRNPLRKVKEAILTMQLEKHLSKKRILEIYFNVVELGPGIFGVEAATQHWFGTTSSALSEEQGVALAAMLPAPKKWTPSSTSQAYLKHRNAIVRRMRGSMWLRDRL